MKKITFIFFFLVLFTILNDILSNPIVTYFINEFRVDKTGWELELNPTAPKENIPLDGWYLTSKTDTAYFKNGINLNDEDYIVITQDSLLSQLNFDPEEDTLTLYYNESNQAAERLCFGNLSLYSVSAPKPNQSIRLNQYYGDYFYLDNTPTIGFENDTLNIKGNIEGYIKDSLNIPIPGVKIIYDYRDIWPNPPIILYEVTNSSGYFNIHEYARVTKLQFEKEGCFAGDTLFQIWPDSTITINIQMSVIVGITEITSSTINSFTLTQNFPNPFNSSTTFIYFLTEDEQVEINIYDEKGELIQTLFKGNQSKGQYKVNWNADNLASGIYFYELKAKNQKMSKKCLLLK